MVISVGVFLIDKNKRILIGHPTHSADGTGFWSIPKGKRDGDETYHTTMAREFLEETGLMITDYPGYEIFLGAETYVHNKKSLVAFAHFVDVAIDKEPKCLSFVTDKEGKLVLDKDGNMFPEMDRFIWATFDEAVNKLHYTQSNILKRNRFIFEHEFANLVKFPGQVI
jgi:predicted NUDIX family NTP pyrophosphohydrolase